MSRFLQLFGGGLDGCFLPVHPRYDKAPTHLLIYNPEQGYWLSYLGAAESNLIVDVYKIPSGVSVSSVRPPQPAEILRLDFEGLLPPNHAKEIERLTRQRERSGNCDVHLDT